MLTKTGWQTTSKFCLLGGICNTFEVLKTFKIKKKCPKLCDKTTHFLNLLWISIEHWRFRKATEKCKKNKRFQWRNAFGKQPVNVEHLKKKCLNPKTSFHTVSLQLWLCNICAILPRCIVPRCSTCRWPFLSYPGASHCDFSSLVQVHRLLHLRPKYTETGTYTEGKSRVSSNKWEREVTFYSSSLINIKEFVLGAPGLQSEAAAWADRWQHYRSLTPLSMSPLLSSSFPMSPLPLPRFRPLPPLSIPRPPLPLPRPRPPLPPGVEIEERVSEFLGDIDGQHCQAQTVSLFLL